MSRFDSMMATLGRPVLLREGGQAVTYRHRDIEPVTLTALVTPVAANEREGIHGRTVRHTREAIIGTDPAAAEGGIASPKANAELLIGTEVWAIERIEMISGSLVRLILVRASAAEVSREGYRAGG